MMQKPIASHVNAEACRRLWCEVLLEQYRCAIGRASPPISSNEQRTAFDWFGSRSFWTVCALAGVDGEAILSALQGPARFHRHKRQRVRA